MSLRFRFALGFALVAIVTAGIVALAVPPIVGRGFAAIEADAGVPRGSGRGPGPQAGLRAQEVQQETVRNLVIAAVVAAGGASLLGVVLAGRFIEPLRRLEAGAEAVASGDLSRRSSVADRGDEIGALGRSFDGMASALEAEDAARRRFFQDAAHELKTPLAVIEATAAAVLDGVYSHEDRHLETIREQSRRLSAIVDDLRTISLSDAGALPLAIAHVDVADLVQRDVVALEPRAAAAGIELRAEATDGLVVDADPDRIRQALNALIDNALTFTPRSGTITVVAERRQDRVRIAVLDTGPGFADADLPHVFERFYRADRARDRATGSSGLGLAIVSSIATAHGGTVGAANADPRGAVVWLELPADPTVRREQRTVERDPG
jgi:two-component system sensor histidine kinase BaeS